MLTEKQKIDIGNGHYHISEGVGAPELKINQLTYEKEGKMSEPKMVTIPETRDLNYRANSATVVKIVFFTEQAVKQAGREGIISPEEERQLNEVLRRPGEITAVIERQDQPRSSWEKSLERGH
jgi:hypothetical protein